MSSDQCKCFFFPCFFCYKMCRKIVAADVFKSLTFIYWFSGLLLTWNFEVFERGVYPSIFYLHTHLCFPNTVNW